MGDGVLSSSHGDLLKVIQWLEGSGALEKDVSLEPPGQSLSELVLGKGTNWNCKDPIKLLKGTLHGLGHPEENHDEGDEVESGVQSKRTERLKAAEKEGKGNTQNGGLGWKS